MTGRDRSEVDRLDELDDTLADGPAPAELPADLPEEARAWLAEQRVMHGLLRALHTADATQREGRVEAIMRGIDRVGTVVGRGHWLSVAAAALLLATFGIWWGMPASLPTADAAMLRAVGELAREVDRRYHVELLGYDRGDREVVHHECDLVTRPGMRFLIDGRFAFAGIRVGDGRIGCDGQELWVLPHNQRFRRSGPLAERERLLEGLGDVLDVGYLDVLSLVEKLPGDFRLRTVGRVTDEQGRDLLRIEAKRRRRGGLIRLRSAELLVDEPTGMVTRLEAELDLPGGRSRRFVIEYLGVAEPGSVDYRRPW